jgi:hypothetical protein
MRSRLLAAGLCLAAAYVGARLGYEQAEREEDQRARREAQTECMEDAGIWTDDRGCVEDRGCSTDRGCSEGRAITGYYEDR